METYNPYNRLDKYEELINALPIQNFKFLWLDS